MKLKLSLKNKIRVKRAWLHLYACHCSACMPHRKLNFKLRMTCVLVLVNVAVWFSIGQLIEPLTRSKTITYHNTNNGYNGQVYSKIQTSERTEDNTVNLASVKVNTSDKIAIEAKYSQLVINEKVMRMFPEDPTIALAIAKSESSLNPLQDSTTDLMQDGRPFSTGLMQINLTVSKVAGIDCTKAFVGRNYHAKVVNEKLYEQCMSLAKNADHNLAAARQKFDGRSQTWGAWGSFSNKSYLRFISNN